MEELKKTPTKQEEEEQDVNVQDIDIALIDTLSKIPVEQKQAEQTEDVDLELINSLSRIPVEQRQIEQTEDVDKELIAVLSKNTISRTLKEKNIPFNGKLVTQYHPTLLNDGDFSELTNFCYTPSSIRTIKGMTNYKSIHQTATDRTIVSSITTDTKHSTLTAYQTYLTTTPSSTVISEISCSNTFPSDSIYLISQVSGQYRIIALKHSTSTAYVKGQIVIPSTLTSSITTYYLECVSNGTTGSAAPAFANYDYNDIITDGTVKWIKRKGNLIGKFTKAPDDTIVFCNGHHNLIYGGSSHRLGKIINTDSVSGLGAELLTNGNFTTNSAWTWGTGWTWDNVNYEADHATGSTSGLSQNISIIAGATYQIVFTLKYVASGSVTFYVGSRAGTTRNSPGTYTELIVAANTSIPIFVPTADFEGSIDNVSLKRVYYQNDIDITEQLTNEQTDDSHIAVLTVASDGTLYLDIGSPLMLRGVNVTITSPNTNNNTILTVYRNTTTGWIGGTIISDGTNKFTEVGTNTILFSFTDDDTTYTLDNSDTITYLHSQFLYWYSIRLTPNTGTLPDTITLSYMTGYTIIHSIPNIWDGTLSIPSTFLIETGTDAYTDNTIEVSKRENSFSFINSWLPSIGTTSRLYPYTTYYIGSILPLVGYRVYFPEAGETITPRNWTNTNTSTLTVYYWDGTSWQAVSGLIDDTQNFTKTITHNKNGTVMWLPVTNEKQRKLGHDIPLYYYKVVSSAAYSAYTYIDYIELIPYNKPIEKYNTCTIWNNRLVLAGSNTSPSRNEILCSAPNSPYIWNGDQTITMYAGSNTPITALATLYTRYGTDIAETLIIFKSSEMFMVTGYDQETVKVYPISHTVGCPYPNTIQYCDLGIRITEGVNRAVVIFASDTAIYLYDNATIVSISDDIENTISTLLSSTTTFTSSHYDSTKSWYHFLSGSYEYIFDLIHKKWFKIDRGTNKQLYSGIFYKGISYGFTSTLMTTLNTGYTMLGSSYTSSFTTALKPLESSLAVEYNIRRMKLLASPSSSTCTLSLITDTSTYSPSSISLSTSSPILISSPINLNLDGTVLKVTGTVTNVSSETELLNITLLYSPKRVTW